MVIHLLADKNTTLSELLSQSSDTSQLNADELIKMGAIYLNKERCPLNSQVIQLAQGDYVRVHSRPKRFPVPSYSAAEVIFAETDDFFVVNKPWGIPVHPTLDNAIENLQTWMLESLQLSPGQVLIGPRLDIGTEGLIIVPKNAESLSRLNKLLEGGKVKKYYECLHEGEVLDRSLLTDWMKRTREAPRILIPDAEDGAMFCKLTILESEKINADICHTQIELLTGRTHQIRVQLASRGRAIRGDKMYGSNFALESPGDRIALRCRKLMFEWKGAGLTFELPAWPLTERFRST